MHVSRHSIGRADGSDIQGSKRAAVSGATAKPAADYYRMDALPESVAWDRASRRALEAMPVQ
jgi:hypothetical protein